MRFPIVPGGFRGLDKETERWIKEEVRKRLEELGPMSGLRRLWLGFKFDCQTRNEMAREQSKKNLLGEESKLIALRPSLKRLRNRMEKVLSACLGLS